MLIYQHLVYQLQPLEDDSYVVLQQHHPENLRLAHIASLTQEQLPRHRHHQ